MCYGVVESFRKKDSGKEEGLREPRSAEGSMRHCAPGDEQCIRDDVIRSRSHPWGAPPKAPHTTL